MANKDAKCIYGNKAEKISPEVLKFQALSQKGQKNIFLTEIWFTTERSFAQRKCVLRNVPEVFKEFGKLEARIT